MEGKVLVTITKTSNGMADYIQVISEDHTSINVVIIAEEIVVVDYRNIKKKEKKNAKTKKV